MQLEVEKMSHVQDVVMEVGFPSQPDSLLNTSQEDPIAGYTSIETLQIIVDKHGGINVGKTLEGLTNKNVQKWKRNLKLKRILNEE